MERLALAPISARAALLNNLGLVCPHRHVLGSREVGQGP